MAFWKAFPKTFTWRWTCFLQPSQWTPGCQKCKFTAVREFWRKTKHFFFHLSHLLLVSVTVSTVNVTESFFDCKPEVVSWKQSRSEICAFYLTASLISFWSPWCQVPRPSIGIWLPVNSSRLLCGIDWYWILLHGMVWYFMVLHGITWYFMALHGIFWYGMVLHGILRYCMAFYGIDWYCLVLHGIPLLSKYQPKQFLFFSPKQCF